MSKNLDTLILTQSQIEEVVGFQDILDRVEDVFRMHENSKEKINQPLKTTMYYSGGKHRITSLPCTIEGEIAGIKWVSNNSENRKNNLPTIAALIILNDLSTTLPLAIMDGTKLTAMRTGGFAAIGAKYLAKKDSDRMAVIGCGVEGRSHLEAMTNLFDINEVKIYDIVEENAEKYKEQMEDKLNLSIEISSNAKKANEDVDIICMTTTSTKPVVYSNDIEAGCYVAGTAQFRDLDPSLSKEADKWVVGDVESDFHALSKSQKIMELSKDDIYTELGKIVTGKKNGRENENERILFSHAGMGVLDIAVGQLVYEKAKDKSEVYKINLLK
jgi:ornithine cyclodeaminase/alanine dehydrogenase-like protein (mu-crystallin family)